MRMKGNKVFRRVYHDYLLPRRTSDYGRILEEAARQGYSFETVSSFDEVLKNGMAEGCKYLILRRDVDTRAFSVLRDMLAEEQKHGAKCSCFFRLETLNRSLAAEIAAAGGEVSYHYEELASYAGQKRLKNRDAALQALPEIRTAFEKNLTWFRSETGQACTAVASHGDFINRKLKLSNTEILRDPALRARCGILREAYDPEQMDHVTCRIADQSSPDFTEEALAAIRRNEPVIYLLTHPRQWGAAWGANTRENASRLIRGLKYR